MRIDFGGLKKQMELLSNHLNPWQRLVIGIGLLSGIAVVMFFIILNSINANIKDSLALKATWEQKLKDNQAEPRNTGTIALTVSRLPEAIDYVEQVFQAYALEVNEITITGANIDQLSSNSNPYQSLGLKVKVSGEQAMILQVLLDIGLNNMYPLAIQEIDMDAQRADILFQLPVYQD